MLALGFVNMSAVSIRHIGPPVSFWLLWFHCGMLTMLTVFLILLLNLDELKYLLRIFVADPCVKTSFSSQNLNDNESSHRHVSLFLPVWL